MSLGTGPSQRCWRSTDGAVVGAPLRVASHADTASGVARSRVAMASRSASALILSPASFARAATVSTLVVGRPLKVTPFRFGWTLLGCVGFAGFAGIAGRTGFAGL